jgi:hypothetical protein
MTNSQNFHFITNQGPIRVLATKSEQGWKVAGEEAERGTGTDQNDNNTYKLLLANSL